MRNNAVRLFCMEMVLDGAPKKLPEYLEWLEGGLRIARVNYPKNKTTHKLIVFPEFVSLPLLHDEQSFIKYAQDFRRVFQNMAKKEQAYVLTCGPQKKGQNTYNTALLLDPTGNCLLSTSKKNLTADETLLGISSSKTLPHVVNLPFGNVGIAICLDAFDPAYIRNLKKEGAEIVLQPSANPQVWAAPAKKSGVWQPEEWAAASVGAVSPENYPIQYLVNPMLRGLDSTGRLFDGQSSIVASSRALHECPYIGVEKKYPAEFLFCSEYDVKRMHQVGAAQVGS